MRVVKGNSGPTRDNQGLNTNDMQVKIALKDTTDVSCDKCGHHYFTQLMMFKKLSAVMSPNGQESMIPVQVFACNACGHVNEQFLPPAGNEE
jgi:hypothetical protein|tara:strand:+ start:25929 stop:26204 length:276 start_codon:yes stop_codon:yes gene_type:complete